MFLELLGGVMIFGGASMGAAYWKIKSWSKARNIRALPNPAHDGTLSWSICKLTGLRCPKCFETKGNRSPGKICRCPEYFQEHFHFGCVRCGFKAVLRTADDR